MVAVLNIMELSAYSFVDIDLKNKKVDPLKLKFIGVSSEHFASDWSIVFEYRVTNLKRGSEYSVWIFSTKETDLPMIECNCVSRIRCKHINAVVKQHLQALELGFLTDAHSILKG